MEHKTKKKKRHYCCVCSNYHGKDVGSQEIVLHRFPANPELRKAWIKRVKSVMPHFKYSRHDRLCSSHFVDGHYGKTSNVPSIFQHNNKTKVFTLSTASTGRPTPTSECGYDELPEDAEKHTENSDDLDQDDEMDPEDEINTSFWGTPGVQTSVMLNDYSKPREQSISSMLNKCVQTDGASCTCKRLPTKMTEDSATQYEMENEGILNRPQEVIKGQLRKNCGLGIQVLRPDITIEDIECSDEKMMFYTGLPNAGTFYALFNEMEDAPQNTQRNSNSGAMAETGRPRILRTVDEFFLVLMRLRLGLLVEDLADRFHVSKSTCSLLIRRWINYLHVKLSFLTPWPSRSVIDQTMPKKFKRRYPRCRVIIDCTEIYTETPQSLCNKSLMYSHYKSHMTYKALLGISPAGILTFASDLWAGSISDKQITANCGMLDLCEPGDSIMGDKGFLISDLTTPRKIDLIIPPLKYERFNRRQVEETRRIANLRIDVERAVERVKNFRILQGNIPITLAPLASQIWKICVHLSNLQPPLVQDEDD